MIIGIFIYLFSKSHDFKPNPTIPMKTKNLIASMLIILCGIMGIPVSGQEASVEPFLGMWALDLEYENQNAGWLEVRQEKGYLDAEMLWRWGSVFPIDFTFVMEDELFLTRGRDVEKKMDGDGNPARTLHPINWFNVRMDGEDKITGMFILPRVNGEGLVEMTRFTGKRIPPIGEAPKVKRAKYGDPIKLFNGKDLSGWELLEAGADNGWKAVDGVLVNDPVRVEGESRHYGNLRTIDTFEDFNLKLEVNIPKGSNSGVYLRGIYEIQVQDSYGKELDSHNMGGLYSRITPALAAEKPGGEWQTMDMTLYKRHLTVKLNGKTLIDNQPVKGITGGAMSSDEFSPGPIYLQGDHGQVRYKNIVLTPIIN